jgi:hypothetical protein
MAQDEELRYTGPDVVIWDDPTDSGDRPHMTEAEMAARLEPGAHMVIKDAEGWRRYDGPPRNPEESHTDLGHTRSPDDRPAPSD